MAQTLYLNDGSMEVLFSEKEAELSRIIYEKLGKDCQDLYEEILEGYKKEAERLKDELNEAEYEIKNLKDSLDEALTALEDDLK